MTKTQKQKFEMLSNRLSPENLCCDGEISRTQVKVRYRLIKKEWRELEKEVGRTVSEEEVEGWIIEGLWARVGHKPVRK